MFQIPKMFLKSVNNSQSYHKSLAQLCHQELAEQLQHFKTFMLHTVVKRGFFSERELIFMFAICRRPSVCRLSVCLSATFLHPTQPIEIFSNVFAPFNTI